MKVDSRIIAMPRSPRRIGMNRLGLLGILILSVASLTISRQGVCIADERLADGDSKSEVSDAELLSQGGYAERQRATLELWRSRDMTRNEVQEATRDPDPEVAQRAKWILRQWQRGVLPGNTPDISRLLRQENEPGDVVALLAAGDFSAAVVAVEEADTTVLRDSVYQEVSFALQRFFPIYVKLALDNDALPEFLRVIDLVADNHELAVCRIQLMQRLGLAIDDDSLLPAASIHWSLAERREARIIVLAILGRLDDALREAEQSNDDRLVRVCHMMLGNWDAVLAISLNNAKAAADGSLEKTRYWCQTLIAADRAGNQEVYDQAVLSLSSDHADRDSVAANLSWQCLASHGEVNAALKILNSISPFAAAQVAMASSRASEAFEILGYPLAEIDQNLDRWINEAIESLENIENEDRNSSPLLVETSSLLMLMRNLIMVGNDDQAWRIANSLARSDAKVGSLSIRDSVLASLTVTPAKYDWIVNLSVLHGERVITPKAESSIIDTLGGTSTLTWKIMMDSIAAMMPERPFRDRLRVVYDLLRGEMPDGFDPNRDFDRLYDRLTTGSSKSVRGRLITSNRSQVNEEIANLFTEHGKVVLAAQCRRQLLLRGDLNAAFQIAQRELEGGGLETARQYYDFIWERTASYSQLRREQSSRVEPVSAAAKSLVGQWIIARRQGDEQRIESLERQIRLTLCAPSTELRRVLAGHLSDQNENLLAEEAYQDLLIMTAMGRDLGTDFVYVASDYAAIVSERDPIGAASWYDLAVSGTLESSAFLPVAYITLPLKARRYLVEAAIVAKDPQAAKHHVERLLMINPLDIDFAERLLPKMRKAGMKALANTTFEKILNTGNAFMEDFPFDSTTANNLAWVAAMNRRDLDEALSLARRAVHREPDSAIYRDTLAEVLFQMGRKQEALQIEQACVLDDPGQWHLHEQIEKYRQAVAAEN